MMKPAEKINKPNLRIVRGEEPGKADMKVEARQNSAAASTGNDAATKQENNYGLPKQPERYLKYPAYDFF